MNPIKHNLEEKFQQLGSKVETPEDLKTEVFNTLDSFNLLGDVLDLFTAKFGETEAQFVDIMSDEESDEEEEGKTDEDSNDSKNSDSPS